MEHVEGSRSQTHGPDAPMSFRRDHALLLQNAQVLHQRGQYHRERRGKFRDNRGRLRQPFYDSPTRWIRESTEHSIDLNHCASVTFVRPRGRLVTFVVFRA